MGSILCIVLLRRRTKKMAESGLDPYTDKDLLLPNQDGDDDDDEEELKRTPQTFQTPETSAQFDPFNPRKSDYEIRTTNDEQIGLPDMPDKPLKVGSTFLFFRRLLHGINPPEDEPDTPSAVISFIKSLYVEPKDEVLQRIDHRKETNFRADRMTSQLLAQKEEVGALTKWGAISACPNPLRMNVGAFSGKQKKNRKRETKNKSTK